MEDGEEESLEADFSDFPSIQRQLFLPPGSDPMAAAAFFQTQFDFESESGPGDSGEHVVPNAVMQQIVDIMRSGLSAPQPPHRAVAAFAQAAAQPRGAVEGDGARPVSYTPPPHMMWVGVVNPNDRENPFRNAVLVPRDGAPCPPAETGPSGRRAPGTAHAEGGAPHQHAPFLGGARSLSSSSSSSFMDGDETELIGRDRFVSLKPPQPAPAFKRKKKAPQRRSARSKKAPTQDVEQQQRLDLLQTFLLRTQAESLIRPMSCDQLDELASAVSTSRAESASGSSLAASCEPLVLRFVELFNDVRSLGLSFLCFRSAPSTAIPSSFSSPSSSSSSPSLAPPAFLVDVARLVEADKKLALSLPSTPGCRPLATSPLFEFLETWLNAQQPVEEIVLDDDHSRLVSNSTASRKKQKRRSGVLPFRLSTATAAASTAPTVNDAAMIDLTDEADDSKQPSEHKQEAAAVVAKEEPSTSSSTVPVSPADGSTPSAMQWILQYKRELDAQASSTTLPSLSSAPLSLSSSLSSSPSSSSTPSAASLPLSSLAFNSLVSLLEFTFLDEQFDVRTALFASLRQLPNSIALTHRLTDHFASLTAEAFQAHLTRLHHFLSLQLTTSMTVNESTIGVLHVMAVLWAAYAQAREKDERLLVSDASAFHNATVNTLVDVEADYHADPIGQHVSGHPREVNELEHFTLWRHCLFLYTAATKSSIIRHHLDSHWQPQQVADAAFQSQHFTVHLTRQRLVADLLNAISRTKYERGTPELRKPLHVVFSGEEGIDAGGLKKESLTLACETLFDPGYGMFVTDDETRLSFFNPFCQAHDSVEEMLAEYELLGNVIGIALLNNVLLPLPFPPVVYAKLLRLPLNFLDLRGSFPRLAASLSTILDYDGSEPLEDVMGLTFTVDTPVLGSVHTHLLVPGGDAVAVTRDNREQYVRLYMEYALTDSVAPVFDAFAKGFWSILPQPWLSSRVSPQDLELLVCGTRELDFRALEASTRYENFPSRHAPRPVPNPASMFQVPVPSSVKPAHAVVKHFWNVVALDDGRTEKGTAGLRHGQPVGTRQGHGRRAPRHQQRRHRHPHAPQQPDLFRHIGTSSLQDREGVAQEAAHLSRALHGLRTQVILMEVILISYGLIRSAPVSGTSFCRAFCELYVGVWTLAQTASDSLSWVYRRHLHLYPSCVGVPGDAVAAAVRCSWFTCCRKNSPSNS